MHPVLVKTINSVQTCRIGAVLVGIAFWLIISTLHNTSITLEIPLCFYNSDTTAITAPEKIQVTLSGKRIHLRTLDFKNLAAHIDASKLTQQGIVIISEKHLLLPHSVKLVNYSPAHLFIKVKREEKQIAEIKQSANTTTVLPPQ